MFNVALLSHVPTDATSWYRGVGPWAALARQHDNVRVELVGETFMVENVGSVSIPISWARLKFFDVVMMQRPATENDLNILKLIKMSGKKIIIDYDDLLTHVPSHNQASKLYNTSNNQAALKQIIAMADLITVSTNDLATHIKQFNSNVHVIKNAFDDDVFRLSPLSLPPQPIVLWRGTMTHQKDLEAVKLSTMKIVEDYPNYQFVFWGYLPDWWKNKVPANIKALPPTDVVQYMHQIRALRPAIVTVPLIDDEFNRSKSSCAWIEATYAGAVTLAPEWDSWREAQPYADLQEYPTVLRNLLSKTPEELRRVNEASMQVIQDKYLLSKANDARYLLLSELMMKRT